MNQITVYHGGIQVVRYPKVNMSRIDIDFGIGFYLTQDKQMAEKWACSKATSVLNQYSLNMEGLSVKHLSANQEWLDYVTANRMGETKISPFNDKTYDIIIGPTADDRIFSTLDLYIDGLISPENALKVINIMHYSEQIVVKKQTVIDAGLLVFVSAKELVGQERQLKELAFRNDVRLASERTRELMRQLNRG